MREPEPLRSGPLSLQPFTLSVVRAADGVEAPPVVTELRGAFATFSLLKAVAIRGHSLRVVFGLRSEPAPDSIRGRTGVAIRP